jgi:hypothetical protein
MMRLTGTPDLDALILELTAHADEQPRAVIMGVRAAGGLSSVVRFAASKATDRVLVHVTTEDHYDPALHESRTLLECRAQKIHDIAVERDGVLPFYVWLVPVQSLAVSGDILYDGQAGRPDFMSFADLGV